jgi:hypothetical protein
LGKPSAKQTPSSSPAGDEPRAPSPQSPGGSLSGPAGPAPDDVVKDRAPASVSGKGILIVNFDCGVGGEHFLLREGWDLPCAGSILITPNKDRHRIWTRRWPLSVCYTESRNILATQARSWRARFDETQAVLFLATLPADAGRLDSSRRDQRRAAARIVNDMLRVRSLLETCFSHVPLLQCWLGSARWNKDGQASLSSKLDIDLWPSELRFLGPIWWHCTEGLGAPSPDRFRGLF